MRSVFIGYFISINAVDNTESSISLFGVSRPVLFKEIQIKFFSFKAVFHPKGNMARFLSVI